MKKQKMQINKKKKLVGMVLATTLLSGSLWSVCALNASAIVEDEAGTQARKDELLEQYATGGEGIGLGDFGLGEVIGDIQGILGNITNLGGLFGELLGQGEESSARSPLKDFLEDTGLTGIYENISDLVIDVGSYIDDDIWGTVQNVLGIDLEGDIFGVLGLPSPNDIKAELEASIKDASDNDDISNSDPFFLLNAGVEGYVKPDRSFSLLERMQALEERGTARSHANATLSEKGQLKMRDSLELSASGLEMAGELSKNSQDLADGGVSIAEESGTISEDSTNTDVTQQILQNLSQQQALSTQALSNISGVLANDSAMKVQSLQAQQLALQEMQKLRQSSAYQNKVMSQVAEQQYRQDTEERRRDVASSFSVMKATVSSAQFGGKRGSRFYQEDISIEDDVFNTPEGLDQNPLENFEDLDELFED